MGSNSAEVQARRQPAPLPKHLNQSLCRYAEAAIATAARRPNWNFPAAATVGVVGLASLALPPFAAAEIVYTPTNQRITYGYRHVLRIDLNHDGIPDASLFEYGSGDTSGFNAELSAGGARFGNGVMMSGSRFASAAVFGKVIGPGDQFDFQGEMAACDVGTTFPSRRYAGSSTGPWRTVRDRYLGIKFEINGETHYGWARFSTTGFPASDHGRRLQCNPTAILTGYAYETIPDMPIVAGVTADDSGENIEPTPGLNGPTLGMLASGSLGLDARGKAR